MGRRSDLPLDARMTAVLAVLKGEGSLEAVARRHGVSPTSLSRWKQRFLESGREGLRDKSRASSREQELEAEIAKRDQLIGELMALPGRPIGWRCFDHRQAAGRVLRAELSHIALERRPVELEVLLHYRVRRSEMDGRFAKIKQNFFGHAVLPQRRYSFTLC